MGILSIHEEKNGGKTRSWKLPQGTPAVTQQRIGFRGKASNFPQRKTGYEGASRDIHAACPLSSFFVKVLRGTYHETGFEGAPLLFLPRQAVTLNRIDVEEKAE